MIEVYWTWRVHDFFEIYFLRPHWKSTSKIIFLATETKIKRRELSDPNGGDEPNKCFFLCEWWLGPSSAKTAQEEMNYRHLVERRYSKSIISHLIQAFISAREAEPKLCYCEFPVLHQHLVCPKVKRRNDITLSLVLHIWFLLMIEFKTSPTFSSCTTYAMIYMSHRMYNSIMSNSSATCQLHLDNSWMGIEQRHRPGNFETE